MCTGACIHIQMKLFVSSIHNVCAKMADDCHMRRLAAMELHEATAVACIAIRTCVIPLYIYIYIYIYIA